ncbi:phage portal protein [Agrobacterium tumefaciens]|uniref:phage portal protein n=1 Tax=Agrobacterium tumefaciens TaxID=358 RepID=UPI0021CF5EDF|nr:phage portal protein [Agrobacterium tumefaciens]UXS04461.1 phage portal protein [Agrobacterium tumefaciens]
MTEKTRVRVKAGSVAVPAARPTGAPSSPRMRAAYLRDTQSGVIASRPASLREHRDEIRRVWVRAAGLAMDMLQNSGKLRGAADQIIADTVGVELVLNPKPDLVRFGYSDKEAIDWIATVKAKWKFYAWNPRECDLRAKLTNPQQTDIGLRNWLAFGESTGIVVYLPRSQRLPGTKTGTKFLLVSPSKLVQDTSEVVGLFQGIIHDAYGRPVMYRFEEKRDGLTVKTDYPAWDADGRPLVMHAFDPFSAEDVRGISPLAPTFRKYLMAENIDDATAQLRFMQTIYSIVLKSEKPSAEAFEALEAMQTSGAEGMDEVAGDFANYFKAKLDAAAEGEIKLGPGAGVSHLAPGEDLEFKSISGVGPDLKDFRASLDRETARALGTSYGGYTLDHTDATYASTNMENSSLWPLAQRRTDRIASPHLLMPYGSWLDEMIEEDEIPFKGGKEAYRANRDAIQYAICHGPSKPTADDEKRARAASERLTNGTSTLEAECAELGQDPEEVFESRARWHKRYKDQGLPSPFERGMGSRPAAAEQNENQRQKQKA